MYLTFFYEFILESPFQMLVLTICVITSSQAGKNHHFSNIFTIITLETVLTLATLDLKSNIENKMRPMALLIKLLNLFMNR